MRSSARTASSAEFTRRYEFFSKAATEGPIMVTEDGQPRAVLLSIEEFERLTRRDQLAFAAAETPDRFLADIEALASDA